MRMLRTSIGLTFGLALLLPLSAAAQADPQAEAPAEAPAAEAPAEAPATNAEASAGEEAPASTEEAQADASETESQEAAPAPEELPEKVAAPVEPAPEKVTSEQSAADAAADAEAADAAKAMEEAMLDDAAASLNEYKLDIYGFADFAYSNSMGKDAFSRPNSTMYVGNLNVYLAGELGDNWSTLAEIRFTYLPHGASMVDSTGETYRYDGRVADYTDLGRPLDVGGIAIERAWLEYSAHPLANVRVGHFLTPYGIWNVDHGSPVIISVRRPFIIGEEMLPESQTGLQIHGGHHFGSVELGYNFTLSNGRGPIDKYQDLDSNKAIGGRLFLRADGDWGQLQLGGSGYGGKYTDSSEELQINPDGSFGFIYPVSAEYDEISLAGDIKYELDGFLIQGEVIRRDIAYEEPRPDNGFGGFAADNRSFGAYGLTGYRFDFLGVMPFFGAEYYNTGGGFLGKTTALWTGLNVRPTPRVVLKAAYTHAFRDEGFDSFNSLDFQAAWSF